MHAARTTRGPSQLVVALWIALLCAVWGSTWIVIQGGLDDLPPFTSAALRFIVSGVAMSVVAAMFAHRERGTAPPARLLITLGTFNFGASYAIVYWSETVLPSGLTSLLWGVFPLLMALAGHWFLPSERLRGAQWLGFVLGFVGLGLLFFTDLRGFGARSVTAAAILLCSPLVSAVGATVIKRHGAGVNSMLLNRNAMLLGAVWLSLLALWRERGIDVHWTAGAVGSVLYLALGGTVFTFGVYFWLLKSVPAYRMSLIAYVTPAIALSLGALLRHETITSTMLAGAAAVLAGVVLVVRIHR